MQYVASCRQCSAGLIQIKNGVAEGDVVATSNLNQLSDGVLVRQMN